ncbi:hypothetical protein COCOBI_18-2430 [Coccomyxa sp. Obi]|nr:hypothetical protein COCOBI_18-2430 [Coccomyxa sp. Obi]
MMPAQHSTAQRSAARRGAARRGAARRGAARRGTAQHSTADIPGHGDFLQSASMGCHIRLTNTGGNVQGLRSDKF